MESRKGGGGAWEGERLTDDCHIGAEAFNRFGKSINAFIDQPVAA